MGTQLMPKNLVNFGVEEFWCVRVYCLQCRCLSPTWGASVFENSEALVIHGLPERPCVELRRRDWDQKAKQRLKTKWKAFGRLKIGMPIRSILERTCKQAAQIGPHSEIRSFRGLSGITMNSVDLLFLFEAANVARNVGPCSWPTAMFHNTLSWFT